jgi:protein TonB
MTNTQLATASLDDIVFDGRNRVYGAYELRALYQRHMSRALIIATAMCALLLVFPLIAQLLKDKTPMVAKKVFINPIDVTIDPTVAPPVITPPPPAAVKPPSMPPQSPTMRNVVPVVVDDKVAPKESDVPNQDELRDKQSGLRDIKGDPGAGPDDDLIDLKPTEGGGGGTGEVVPSKPYTFVEQMPELPSGGGQLAIVAAIQRAVKYPSLALHNGVEGKIYVSFTVNAKGDVIDAKIVKGLGSGLDEETLHAINTLPRFIPGKQNGREVSVSFTVPVTYRIQ